MMYKSQNTVMTSLVKFSLFLIYMVALSPVHAANHAISASNFTMFDPSGALVGGATDVNGMFDDTKTCDTESCTDFAMTLASDQPFFTVQWFAHDIRVFSEGTYTFDSGCTAAEIQAGTTNCAAPGPTIDLDVGPGQLGAHILFDYDQATDIDVVLLWDLDDAFGDPIYDGCPDVATCDPTQTPTKPWNLVSRDGDASGIRGFAMVDGPFPGFHANFNLDMNPPYTPPSDQQITDSNFTMFDPSGALVGGATDVNGTFNSSKICDTESCTDFAMTLASDQPFFTVQWFAHDIRVFSEGTYTFDSGCTAAEIQAGTTNCAAPGPTIDLDVGPGQLGAHILFDYDQATDIDVVLLWDQDDAFGDPIYDGCPDVATCDPTQTPTKPWNLVSRDGDASGIRGFAMVDGPFPGFHANFNLDITPSTPLVDLSGSVKTGNDLDVCAMVLASGQYTFSCNPIGEFSLTDLPRESSGKVKRQIYADGFFPKIDILTESTHDVVVMTRSGSCPSYNQPYTPGTDTGSAGKRIDISGKVLVQDSPTPICAMVLANGQYMFSCDGTGSYALNIPLDANGQFKLQVYADGFAPTIQRFDEVKATNDVRMARAAECQ